MESGTSTTRTASAEGRSRTGSSASGRSERRRERRRMEKESKTDSRSQAATESGASTMTKARTATRQTGMREVKSALFSGTTPQPQPRQTKASTYGDDQSNTQADTLESTLPGAYAVDGLEQQEGAIEYFDVSVELGMESERSWAANKNAGLHVAKAVNGTTSSRLEIDEVEMECIKRKAEDDVKAKVICAAHAISVNDEKGKKSRRLYTVLGSCCVLIIVVAIVGTTFALTRDSSNLSHDPEISDPFPTAAPVSVGESASTCETALDITDMAGKSIVGTTEESNPILWDTCGTITSNGNGVFYSIFGDGKVKYASTCNDVTDFDTQISIYSSPDGCSVLECTSSASGNDQLLCGDKSMVAWDTVPGQVYFIFVHGYRNSNGIFSLEYGDLADNDEMEGAVELLLNDESTFGSTHGATIDENVTGCDGITQSNGGVWFKINRDPSPLRIFIDSTGLTSFQPVLSLYGSDMKCIQRVEDISLESSDIEFSTYYILVHGVSDPGDFRIGYSNLPNLSGNDPSACRIAPEIMPGDRIGVNTLFAGQLNGNSCGRGVFARTSGSWSKISAGTGDIMRVSTCGDGLETQISVYGGSCDELICIAGNQESSACGELGGSTVSWKSELGQPYFIHAHGGVARAGKYNITLDDSSTSKESLVSNGKICMDAEQLPIDQESILSNFLNASLSEYGSYPGVWYELSKTGTGRRLTVSACDGTSTAGLGLIVLAGKDCDNLQRVDTIATPCGAQESVTWDSVKGEHYFVFVQENDKDSSIDPFQGFVAPGSFTLFAGETSFNDDYLSPIGPLLPNGSASFGSLWSATVDVAIACDAESKLTSLSSERGVWYSVSGSGIELTASSCSAFTGFDAKISIFSATDDCDAGLRYVSEQNQTKCEDGTGSEVSWASEAGVMYFVRVHGDPVGADNSNFALAITESTSPNFP